MNTTPAPIDEWSAQWKKEFDAGVRASRCFNQSAIDRVLTAVGRSPLTLDAFADALERVAKIYAFWHDANDQPWTGEIHKWLTSLVGALRKLRKLLTNPPGEDPLTTPPGEDPRFLAKLVFTAGHDRHDISEIRRAVKGIQVLEAAFGRMLRDRAFGHDRIGSRSAEHWLIGEALPKVYTEHFAQKFGRSRDKSTGKLGGPGIRFIVEVLSIMKVRTRDDEPFTPEAIEYYLRPARS